MSDDSGDQAHDPARDRPQGVRSREQAIGDGVTWLSRWTLRWLIIGVGALALGFVVSRTWSVLLPVVLAMILTSLLEPLSHLLERRLHLPAALAAAITLVGTLAALVALFFALAPSVGNQVVEIASNASGGLGQVEKWVADSPLDVTQDQVEAAVAAIQSKLSSSASSIASGVLVGVSAISTFLINLLLTLVLTFFFLKDGRRFLPWARSVVGPDVGRHVVEVGSRSWATLGSFIRTQSLVGLLDAIFIGTGLVIIGVPLAGPLAVLTFFGGFVPIIGAVTVGALAVLVTLVTNGLTAALIVFALILAVQQIEGNVFQPLLQGRTMRLHAMVILLAVTLGSTLFGIIGAFLSVPVVSVVAVVLRYLDEILHVRTALPVAEGPEPPPDERGDGPAPAPAG